MRWTDLFEAKNKGNRDASPWTISLSSIFEETLRDNLRIFPDLREKLAKFQEVKLADPLMSRYGKHDRPCTHELSGFQHCHLRDDAILIYKLVNRSINLVCIVSHAEIEGKRLKKTASRIQKFL